MKKTMYLVLVLTLLLANAGVIGFAADMEGEGTEGSPFVIMTPEHFMSLNNTGATGCYRLGQSINLGSYTPFSFRGKSFDGDGHTLIVNIVVSTNANTGLFSGISTAGVTIKDLTVSGSIKSTGVPTGVGGIVGSVTVTGLNIENCTNEANIQGKARTGGIVGRLNTECTISGCINKGLIEGGTTATGGIVGQLSGKSSIINCQNYGAVSSPSYTGGIIGWITSSSAASNAMVQQCGNYGTITGTDADYAAGIAGLADYTDIKKCFNMGTIIKSDIKAAGILGSVTSGRTCNVDNCYNVGYVRNNGTFRPIAGTDANINATNNYHASPSQEPDTISNSTPQTAEELEALFDIALPQLYVVEVDASEGGEIDFPYDVYVKEDGTHTVRITPETGYAIDYVFLNDQPIYFGTFDEKIYKIENINADLTLDISFISAQQDRAVFAYPKYYEGEDENLGTVYTFAKVPDGTNIAEFGVILNGKEYPLIEEEGAVTKAQESGLFGIGFFNAFEDIGDSYTVIPYVKPNLGDESIKGAAITVGE